VPAAARRPFAPRPLFPINYSLMQPLPPPAPGLRLSGGTGAAARTAMIVCTAFHKPVSRCFLARSPEVDGEDGR
jgi:hypothetical protein